MAASLLFEAVLAQPGQGVGRACAQLCALGAEVVLPGAVSISLRCSKTLADRLGPDRLTQAGAAVRKRYDLAPDQSWLCSDGPDPTLMRVTLPALAEGVSGFVRIPPSATQPPLPGRPIHAPRPPLSPLPPDVPYFHLQAPEDLSALLGARDLHQRGETGRGVRVAVVDSGFYAHPWFGDRDLSVSVLLAPGARAPARDEIGHGTMVCAALLSLAPGAQVTLVKQNGDDEVFVAFKLALSLSPDIIQNTWGYSLAEGPLGAAETLIAATLEDAIARGILVVFAGGNGGLLYPSQRPEVLAIGGVFQGENGARQAASYASGYISTLIPGRWLPDFCALVGMAPMGVYLAMPTQPGGQLDRAFAQQPYPEGDDTPPTDGWVVISGTSAASAQVSGLLALLRAHAPTLSQERARALLAKTARAVHHGASAQGNPAGPGQPNVATGYGLVDAQAAFGALPSVIATINP
ncbi:peptidase S8 [Rhodospirillum rubrum]|uniref:S8 family serine peptidase n=1 Tax=Rhodospirillum rubrum TaxID=1085 RepID=UPI001907718E|nr:S8 family serine peptidase [Rhodospirillum rubrum]MBK1666086.1 peptidase S8 [Rhodospirillum rubrum]MBK1678352.1 peptidase S8 [Rhodospirillum rubrum]